MAVTASDVQRLLVHFLIALTVSFALSVVFWFGFGVFVLSGFILWSVVCAAAGAVIGYFGFRSLFWTIVLTGVFRVAVYVLMTQV